jgi:hypothetical protein
MEHEGSEGVKRGMGQAHTLSFEQEITTGSMLLHSTSWLTAGARAATAERMVMRYR